MVSILPYIPVEIVVHLGAPDEPAENVRVSYLEYLQNVAASELYPTWALSALRANILAINSYALNRVYTEYYRSRGYDFDITNTTAFDQAFVYGRSTFEITDDLALSLIDTYIRRQGFIEPLAAKFCNGTTSVCDGLSQWGSQRLAEEGLDSVEILKTFYGDDIELVSGAPVKPIVPSYDGTPLRLGSYGDSVTILQLTLNRISQNYPAIPKINPVDGYFSEGTEQAVRRFQEIFGLEADGIVGEITWYEVIQTYVAVKKLAELQSEGQRLSAIPAVFPGNLTSGDTGQAVDTVQYLLDVISVFRPLILENDRSGTYDASTVRAVEAYQQEEAIPVSGTVDQATWYALHRSYEAIDRGIFQDAVLFRYPPLTETTDTAELHRRLTQLSAAFPSVTRPDTGEDADKRSVTDFQQMLHLTPCGIADHDTQAAICTCCDDLRYAFTPRPRQFCGYLLHLGVRDAPVTAEQRGNPRIVDCDRPVYNLQQMLRSLSELPCELHPDGIYSEDTAAAVADFQRSVGLPATGTVDCATWQALVSRCPAATQQLRFASKA